MGAEGAAGERALVRVPRARAADRVFTFAQIFTALALLASLVFAGVNAAGLLFIWLHVGALFVFSVMIGARLLAAAASLAPAPRPIARWAGPKPIYTILCPLFLEAEVAPQLVENLKRLDYPPELLDVKLILEHDDVETIAAVQALELPAHFDVIVTPHSALRTKPRALNIALARAKGPFVCIYDAEDAPHPQQLNAALDAFASNDKLACVQAPLLIDRAQTGWLAAQFAAEYAVQFGAILPLLARLGLPMPLGGTSNHFRTAALETAGGWDAFNVTEDADLGYRLAREGWRVGVIAPPTLEEAPETLAAWMRQRTRWIKGHMQTWFVLMRNPFETAREMGLAAFFSMQIVLLGGLIAAFAHGPLFLLLALSLATPLNLLSEADIALAISGYATAIYSALAVAALLRDARVARAALTMPFYWPLATIAALKALRALLTRPHHWEKTEHGLVKRSMNAPISAAT